MARSDAATGRAAGVIALLALAGCATTPPAPVRSAPDRPPGPMAPSDQRAPRIIPSADVLQCVPYARGLSGIQIYGDAHQWWTKADGAYPRSNLPAVGSVIAMQSHNGAARGHVAVVTAVRSAREILVAHANWLNRGEVSLDVPVRDISPAGDWSLVNVWHVPGENWGVRAYPVDGFILPR